MTKEDREMENAPPEIKAPYQASVALIKEFQEHRKLYNRTSITTHQDCMTNLLWTSRFMALHFRKSLGDAVYSDIEAIVLDRMKRNKKGTIMKNIIYMHNFFKWAFDHKIKENFPMESPEGKKIHRLIQKNKGIISELEVDKITSIDSIWKIRQSNIHSLPMATLFEVLVSSGLRIGEAHGLRCNHIQFHNIPYDSALGCVSPYCGGTIQVAAWASRNKKTRSRQTFISVYAAKMLRAYMKSFGLTTEMNTPLFPYGLPSLKQMIPDEIRRQGLVFKSSVLDHVVQEIPSTGLCYGFRDIKKSPTQNEAYNKILKRTQERTQEKMEELNYEDKDIKKQMASPPTKIRVSSHMLRHLFAIFMYHRNYFGGVHDAMTLQNLLGHASPLTLQVYLKYSQFNPITMNDFKRLMLGNGTEWMQVKIRNADFITEDF